METITFTVPLTHDGLESAVEKLSKIADAIDESTPDVAVCDDCTRATQSDVTATVESDKFDITAPAKIHNEASATVPAADLTCEEATHALNEALTAGTPDTVRPTIEGLPAADVPPPPPAAEIPPPPAATVERDSAGVEFDENLHTGTKTSKGLWRKKRTKKAPADDGPTVDDFNTRAGILAMHGVDGDKLQTAVSQAVFGDNGQKTGGMRKILDGEATKEQRVRAMTSLDALAVEHGIEL